MTVEIVRRGAGRRYRDGDLKRIAAKLLAMLKQHRAELSIALVGDSEMRKLNAKYRKKNSTTDVLSFPSEEKLPTGSVLLGDVVVSVDQARRQAKEHNKTFKSEMATLLIHGVLHLLGYDHERSAKEARKMARLEKRIYRVLCEQRVLRV
ncbi:MAG: rRNA maturation RNase YbeY [Candidatus Binatia bacterium]